LGGSYGAAASAGFDGLRRGLGISCLRARPKGAALWKPAAFEKAGETFFRALLSGTGKIFAGWDNFLLFWVFLLKDLSKGAAVC